MNVSQRKKLARLAAAQDELATELASVAELLNSAENDDDRSAAQKLHDEAVEKLEAARREHDEYQAKLDDKSSGDGSASKEKPASKSKSKSGVIEVVATHDRRRAGRAFPKGKTVEIPADDLTEDQLTALRDDPVLFVKE